MKTTASMVSPLFFIFMTLAFTIYGQLIIKWRVTCAGSMPHNPTGVALYLMHLLLNPWVISGLFAAFLASLNWMMAVSKLPLSYAYPFMSLAFPLTIILSAVIFHEVITIPKIIGTALIIGGVMVLAKG